MVSPGATQQLKTSTFVPHASLDALANKIVTPSATTFPEAVELTTVYVTEPLPGQARAFRVEIPAPVIVDGHVCPRKRLFS
jgi:hypothetical protein